MPHNGYGGRDGDIGYTPTVSEEEEMLTITKAAAELHVSRSFVYTLIERGELKPERNTLKKSHTMRIPASQVEALKRKHNLS